MNTDAQPDLRTIRNLLLAAFTAQDLRRFCVDQPSFQDLTTRFAPKANLQEMVDEVIDFCRTRALWGEFLPLVQEARPRQCAIYFGTAPENLLQGLPDRVAGGQAQGALEEELQIVHRGLSQARKELDRLSSLPPKEADQLLLDILLLRSMLKALNRVLRMVSSTPAVTSQAMVFTKTVVCASGGENE